jgi:beta-galactosidase
VGLHRIAGAWLGALLLLAPALSLGEMPTRRPEQLLSVDAAAPAAPPKTGYLHMGTGRAPDGQTLGINSRYLTLDGRPWLPVMGEFHYWRVPAADWDEELAKVKAAGVDVVSTYVYWAYQEREAGRFDWRGRHDLRRFVQLCGRHGLKVILRLGPWIHAETRFGGLPDWLVKLAPTRSNDPVYLRYVARYFDQIGIQARGLLWKNGGPIIGVQLENEYHLTGPEQGREHIAMLKKVAVQAGFDVPLYTVTAWDNAIYPRREVIPMFGGYPGLPWDTSLSRLPPNEVYAFRFRTRVTGDTSAASLAAQTAGDATRGVDETPFLAAEFGGGLPAMYRRRLLASPDDIASMLVVQIGSGVNLYGYYMFHGGVNPPGGPWEETTASGGYNDVPRRDYDFQAPIGAFGQQRAVLGKLRMVHLFLHAFGAQLAPMGVRTPARVPSGSNDLGTPRWAVRSAGDSGFLFFNNHVRQYAMPARRNVRFQVRLPHRTLVLPSAPVDIPPDAYFIWPLDFNMDGAVLRYATAQPVTRLGVGRGAIFVFRAVPGIAPELAFDAATVSEIHIHSGRLVRSGSDAASADLVLVEGIQPGAEVAVSLRTRSGAQVRVLVLPQAQAEHLWVVALEGRERLLLTGDQVFERSGALELRSAGDPHFSFALLPAPGRALVANLPLRAGKDGAFERLSAQAPPRSIPVRAEPLRRARQVPPIGIGGSAEAAMQPSPETYGDSAAWTLTLPRGALTAGNAYLEIEYRGDVARLYAGTRLLDDNFADGEKWEIGLEDYTSALGRPLTLTVLPLRADAPIYLQRRPDPAVPGGGQIAQLGQVRVVPVYRLRIH